MKRPWQIWLAFAASLVVAVPSVGWLSYRALESERLERTAQARAGLEENARLALWRMDSALAPLLAQENSRPPNDYRTVSTPIAGGKGSRPRLAVVAASPLLHVANPQIKLFFELNQQAELCSPLVLDPAIVAALPPGSVKSEDLERHQARLDELRGLVKPDQLLAALPASLPKPTALASESVGPPIQADFPQLPSDPGSTHLPPLPPPTTQALVPPATQTPVAQSPVTQPPATVPQTLQPPSSQGQQAAVPRRSPSVPLQGGQNAQVANDFNNGFNNGADLSNTQSAYSPEQQLVTQRARGASEFQARSQYVANNSIYASPPGSSSVAASGAPTVMVPLWLDGQLLLARRATLDGESVVQGCWLDWVAIQQQLLAAMGDLLPGAQLLPADMADGDEQAHMMAALPVRLVPGELVLPATAEWSPVKWSLLFTWSSLLLAALAVAALLAGVMALSERRAAFVSAVTHELRTPLTTFRMYAEMLVEGMVPDEASRQRYLETLRTEADRLTHLVENVLAYARLERGGLGRRIGPVRIEQLLSSATERLAPRAAEAGFEVSLQAAPEILQTQALADPAAVEQILFNLVDNACKYARNGQRCAVDVGVRQSGGRVLISVRDWGAGVAPRERRRLFQAFRKSAGDAAESAPGVGLGLALSRRLARSMGGDLSLEQNGQPGACFVLSLQSVAGVR